MRSILILLAVLALCSGPASGQPLELTPIPVELKFNEGHWQLLRNGKPYYVKGAGGLGPLKLLRERGGNSNRSWGEDLTLERLNDAHANGISMAVGIWLEHATRGYDYQDYNQVNDQIEKALETVKRFKDHPAVLVWGVGNEMEGYGSGDNPAIWHHVDHLCRRIKEIDPHHPTMSVVAEIGGNRIKAINQFCPNLDIIGINSYGGAASIPQRYRDAGGTKPYIVTEFGPFGPWESARDEINTVVEPFSNNKAEKYKESYLGFTSDKSLCLGSYSFLWGQKMEATSTWFGMLLDDGRPTNMVDVISELWTGKVPTNRAPVIESLRNLTGNEVDGGKELEFELSASDPEGTTVSVKWVVLPEADSYITFGEFKPNPQAIPHTVLRSDIGSATIKAPDKSGFYRVYTIVEDDSGSVATANLAFKVKYRELETPGKKVPLPCIVYDEPDEPNLFESRFIGDETNSHIDLGFGENPKSGKSCIKWTTQPSESEIGFAFTNDKGLNLMGAKRLSIWAKGTTGKEKIKLGIGLGCPSENAGDTFVKEKTIPLTRYWKKFHVDFANADLRRIKNGFRWSIEGTSQPTEIYLDKIEFE